MPIYEYGCRKCGEHIEKRQSISDEPLRVCETCGGELEKKISLSGFQFKGAGWYVTDYSGKNGGSAETKAEKSSEGESTSPADTASKEKSEAPAAETTKKPATTE